jgi:hypothetical protein
MTLLILLALVPSQNTCTITRDGHALVFRVGDRVVGRYLIDPAQTKPHFHPLFSPQGKRITRAFPMEKDVPGETKDHVHHRGVWVGHQIVILDNKDPNQKPLNANFWAEAVNPLNQQLGKQICTKVEEPQTGSGRASVVTHNTWQTVSGTKVLEETRTVHLHDLGAAQLIVLDVDLHATEGAITFGDEKDGFFALRVNDDMAETRKKGGLLENAEGKQHMETKPQNPDRAGCWGLKSDWVDYSGIVDGEKVGITLFDHPKNPVRACWHARNYGLLSANPFGRAKSKFPDAKEGDLVKLPAGEHLRFRYAALIHPGDVREGKVAEHFQRFVNLP